jgi:hypothetical protein
VANLYGRDWYVIINDLKVAGLRLKFKVEKTITGEPNKLDLHVYNLAASTRAKMQAKDVPVVLVAGYKETAQVIFAGDVRTIDHVREGASWDTHIQSGDGELSFRDCFSSHSFSAGTAWRDVATTLAKDLKANVGDAVAHIAGGDFDGAIDKFLQGYTAHGPTVREFDKAMKAGGLEWSIQDGKLQILAPRKANDEGAILLSPGTGLVGSPDHCSPKDGEPAPLQVRSLLQGGLRPGRAIEVRASKISGFYRCSKVVHEGDTHGGEWYTTVEAEPL